jgi:8-oxo-dGTP pyrophosphatase MutT (NUDIX family)
MQRHGNPWKTLSVERRFEDDFINVDADQVINPAGHQATYGVVRFKGRGLRILPVDDEGQTYLVGQWRYGAGYYSWELPAGNQEQGEQARVGAARELREETGHAAEHWLELLEIVNSGSVTDQRERSFVAWGLRTSPLPQDEQERIRCTRVPFGRAVEMAIAGEIGDAGTIVALVTVQLKALRGELPPKLLELLRVQAAA